MDRIGWEEWGGAGTGKLGGGAGRSLNSDQLSGVCLGVSLRGDSDTTGTEEVTPDHQLLGLMSCGHHP